MRIVFAEKIAEYIKNCSPEYIAVAFVGADWREFIPDWKKIKSIVVSPTLGSNPKAIHEIVKELGWEKVEFLDNLHAKLYLGENSAISGSANLTKNGLSGNILHELCTVTHNPQHLKSFKIFFDHIRSKAKDSYPTVEQKKHKLDELFQVWGRLFLKSYLMILIMQLNLRILNYYLIITSISVGIKFPTVSTLRNFRVLRII